MKKSRFLSKSADSIQVGERIWVYGKFVVVTQVKLLVIHPMQFIEIWITGVAPPLRVPAGWQIKVERLGRLPPIPENSSENS
jgi:hypothetical protein